MTTQIGIHKSTVAPRLSSILHGRIENLVNRVVAEIENSSMLSAALQLDDEALMHQVFVHYLAESSRIDKREQLKIKRHIEGSMAFYNKLERLGGTLRASEVADLLGVSRQTVNNYAKSGKLLAVKPAKESLFPIFQFDEHNMLPHFESVLELLPKSMSSVTKVSFFTSMFLFKDDDRSVLDILKEGKVTDAQLKEIMHQARLMGSQAG